MSWLNYIPAKIIALAGLGYGRLYNWFCTQPQQGAVKYGYLYNWYAVDDARGIANTGARVPTNAEWNILVQYLGGSEIAGGKLKKTGEIVWATPNIGASDDFGFGGVGSGSRSWYGFNSLSGYGFYHSSDIDLYYGNGLSLVGGNAQSQSMSYPNPPGTYEKDGLAIRLIIDNPIEISGNSAIYVGNDLRRYKCVLINNIWYLAENLAETKYRDGSLIAVVADETAWGALATGGMCTYDNLESNVFEASNIAPTGWHVPTQAEWGALGNALDAYDIYHPDNGYSWPLAGGLLKESGTTHWADPNVGALNSVGFKGFGAGTRYMDGVFNGDLTYETVFISSTSYADDLYFAADLSSESARFSNIANAYKTDGNSLRLIKDDSTWNPGDTVTDVDGNIYPTVKIGDQVWMDANWKCTKYNDGTPIPNITDHTEWANQTQGAQCVYGNDPNNL